MAAGKLCQSSSKWVPFSNLGIIRHRKKRERLCIFKGCEPLLPLRSLIIGVSGLGDRPGQLSFKGRPPSLDRSRARTRFAWSRCGWVLHCYFSLSPFIPLFSRSLLETARYILRHCLKGPLNRPPPPPTKLHLLFICFAVLLPFNLVIMHKQVYQTRPARNTSDWLGRPRNFLRCFWSRQTNLISKDANMVFSVM